MKRTLAVLISCFIALQFSSAQNFGNFPGIEKERLLNDLDILYQGLDKFHSGMYWYTPKDSVAIAFQEVREKITTDLNVLEFHKLIAPLVALSREDHTDLRLSESVNRKINTEAKVMPLTLVFLGKELFCVENGSDFQDLALEGKQVESINGETPIAIVNKIGSLFASDGFIKPVKYSDLKGFNFSKYYFYHYGLVSQFEIKFKDIKESLTINPLSIREIINNKKNRNETTNNATEKDLLEYEIINDSIAYLGIHSFSNGDIRDESKEKSLKSFLKSSFKSIKESNVNTLILDVSENSGGSEGNEGLLYSYFGEDYQKYKKVRAKTDSR